MEKGEGVSGIHFAKGHGFAGALAAAALLALCGCTDASSAKLASLESEVATLRAQARRADDYIAILNLQSIYGYYVDKSQWDQAADLFAKNATLEIAGRGLFTGQDRIREYLHQLGPLQYGKLFNHTQLQ